MGLGSGCRGRVLQQGGQGKHVANPKPGGGEQLALVALLPGAEGVYLRYLFANCDSDDVILSALLPSFKTFCSAPKVGQNAFSRFRMHMSVKGSAFFHV